MVRKTPVTKDSFQAWHMDIIHQDTTLDTLHHLGHTHLKVTPQHLGDILKGTLHRDTLRKDTPLLDTHQQVILVHLLHIKVCIITKYCIVDLAYGSSSVLVDCLSGLSHRNPWNHQFCSINIIDHLILSDLKKNLINANSSKVITVMSFSRSLLLLLSNRILIIYPFIISINKHSCMIKSCYFILEGRYSLFNCMNCYTNI